MVIDITNIDDDFDANMRVDPKKENTKEPGVGDTYVHYFPFRLRLSPATGQVKWEEVELKVDDGKVGGSVPSVTGPWMDKVEK